MATHTINALGLRCPQPILKIAAKVPEVKPGDLLEVTADCTTFEEDVRKWCERMKKTLLSVTVSGATKVAKIQF